MDATRHKHLMLIINDILSSYYPVNTDEYMISQNVIKTPSLITAKELKKAMTSEKPCKRISNNFENLYNCIMEISNLRFKILSYDRIHAQHSLQESFNNDYKEVIYQIVEECYYLQYLRPFFDYFLPENIFITEGVFNKVCLAEVYESAYKLIEIHKEIENNREEKEQILLEEIRSINRETLMSIFINYEELTDRIKREFPNNFILTSKKLYYDIFDELEQFMSEWERDSGSNTDEYMKTKSGLKLNDSLKNIISKSKRYFNRDKKECNSLLDNIYV